MTFLLSEDKALREKLQGMVVHDQKADGVNTPRQVAVFFGQPDQEIRSQTYPYITIDMLGVARDTSREMRGYAAPDYLAPAGLNPDTEGFKILLPIPVLISYQITSYARHPYHDRAIISQLLAEKFPIRFGVLELDDGTIRRLDITDVSKRDVTEQAKRLFVNAVTVQVSSEISQTQATTLAKVTSVNLADVLVYDTSSRPGDPKFISPGGFTTHA